MITEDYVSFETAKLLKEKGFDVYGDGSYDSGIEIYKEYSPFGKLNSCVTSKPHRKAYAAPTLQMVMKWLREVHNIDICVCQELDEQGKCFNGYIAVVCKDDRYRVTIREATKDLTYEEAANKAIKYGLTLI